MSKTKAEIRAFLDSRVGLIVPHPGYPDLNGQCVTLTKALLEFLGVPNPYKARGDAKNAGDTYLREGIADNGAGWLTIVVNRDMGLIGGVRYGHIWVDLKDEANYESNGARALHTTKNTRPISQGQQFINLDKWVTKEGNMNLNQARYLVQRIGLLAHMSEAEINNKEWVDYHAKNVVANPDYAAALAKQLYEGKHWQDFNWKGVVYNNEITKRDQAIEELEKQVEAGGGDKLYEPIAEVAGKPTLFVRKQVNGGK